MNKNSRQYANFNDPLGLVLRMLRSGDRAARGSLYRAALELVLRPVDVMLRPVERRRLAAAPEPQLPIVLIVGPPRSGTTLVCQVLARALPVTFFSNFSALFPSSTITASVVQSKLSPAFRRGGAAPYHSYYGNTRGLSGPNDGFHVWNRWLGSDRYRVRAELSEQEKTELRAFFGAWQAAHRLPLVNKNNRNTACLGLLSELLPTASFVVIQRDPLYVAQSLLIARERIQGSKSVGWGLGSREQPCDDDVGSYADDVARQVLNAVQLLERERCRVSPDRVVDVRYESFCDDPVGETRRIAASALGIELPLSRLETAIGPLRHTNRIAIAEQEFATLRASVERVFGSPAR